MKFVSFIKKTVVTLFCLFVFVIIGGFLCVHSYARFDQAGQVACLANYSAVSSNIYTDVAPNDDMISELNAVIEALPSNISDIFVDDWRIVVSPNVPHSLNLSDPQHQLADSTDNVSGALSVLGYTDWHLRLIYLKAQPDVSAIIQVFAHELGHCFDYEFGSPSHTDEFGEIYSLYKDTFVEHENSTLSGHANSSPEEFFATAFKEFFLFPEELKMKAPQAYDFVNAFYTQVSDNPAALSTVEYDLRSSIVIIKEKITQWVNNIAG